MLYGLVLAIHVVVALFLVAVILLQGGRGGMGETLGGVAAQSLFGGGANVVMARIPTVAAGMFIVTCLSLAALSTTRGRSVIDRVPVSVDQLPAAIPQAPNQPPGLPGPAATSEGPAAPAEPSASSTNHETTPK